MLFGNTDGSLSFAAPRAFPLGLPYPPPDPKKQGKSKARQTFSTNKETLQFVRLALKTGFSGKSRDERDKIEQSCTLLDSITEFRSLAKLMGSL